MVAWSYKATIRRCLGFILARSILIYKGVCRNEGGCFWVSVKSIAKALPLEEHFRMKNLQFSPFFMVSCVIRKTDGNEISYYRTFSCCMLSWLYPNTISYYYGLCENPHSPIYTTTTASTHSVSSSRDVIKFVHFPSHSSPFILMYVLYPKKHPLTVWGSLYRTVCASERERETEKMIGRRTGHHLSLRPSLYILPLHYLHAHVLDGAYVRRAEEFPRTQEMGQNHQDA